MAIDPRMPRPGRMAMLASGCLLAALAASVPASAQLDPRRGPPGCVPLSERRMERGCCILVSHPLGELPSGALFWHIDVFPSRAAAEAALGPHGTVVEALGRTWLMSIAGAAYKPPGGERVAEVGPLVTKAGTAYTAAYMEGIMLPGAATGVHHHLGPEAIVTLAGEECMETPAGRFVGRPGGPPIVIPADVPHRLTITGTGEREPTWAPPARRPRAHPGGPTRHPARHREAAGTTGGDEPAPRVPTSAARTPRPSPCVGSLGRPRATAGGGGGERMADVGRLLHPDDRDRLLAAFPPAYPRAVARQVALEGGEPPDFPLPDEAEGFVVGVADDGAGVQALVAEIGGTTRRPDGSSHHIAWSLAPGRKAAESNDVIRERGWTAAGRRHRVRLRLA